MGMSQLAALSGIPAQDTTLPGVQNVANGASATEHLLMETLSLVRESWAKDFMFKMDPAADVSALTSPVQLRYGMVVDTMSSMFESDEEYGGMFDVDMSCRWLIVPTFNIGNLAADVVVQSSSSPSENGFRFCVGTAS